MAKVRLAPPLAPPPSVIDGAVKLTLPPYTTASPKLKAVLALAELPLKCVLPAASVLKVVRPVTLPLKLVTPAVLTVKACAPSSAPKLMAPVPLCTVVLALRVEAPTLTVPVPSVRPITRCVKPETVFRFTCKAPVPPLRPMVVPTLLGAMVKVPAPEPVKAPATLMTSELRLRLLAPVMSPAKSKDEPSKTALPLSTCTFPP